jgi:NAD(P)-dependent dehydrogenase (short-subunit alcohol dehydrogenase family)
MTGVLDGQVAIVTGAGRGIGRGIALDLAKAGAKVALVARSAGQLDAVAAEITRLGGTAIALPCDVTDRSAVEGVVATVAKRFGRIDFLLNNAGVDHPYGPIGVADPDDWWHAQNVHVRGALLFMHACLPHMHKAGRGRIVNMASLAATMIGPGTSAYCTAKASLVRLTEHVDAEQKDNGTRAFTGHPGTIVTEMMHDTLSDPDAIKYAPHIIGYLTPFLAIDTSGEAARLGAQMVEIAAGLRDDAAGRYVDFEQEIRPERFGPPPAMAMPPQL